MDQSREAIYATHAQQNGVDMFSARQLNAWIYTYPLPAPATALALDSRAQILYVAHRSAGSATAVNLSISDTYNTVVYPGDPAHVAVNELTHQAYFLESEARAVDLLKADGTSAGPAWSGTI